MFKVSFTHDFVNDRTKVEQPVYWISSCCFSTRQTVWWLIFYSCASGDGLRTLGLGRLTYWLVVNRKNMCGFTALEAPGPL
jgi:hypothetical protein